MVRILDPSIENVKQREQPCNTNMKKSEQICMYCEPTSKIVHDKMSPITTKLIDIILACTSKPQTVKLHNNSMLPGKSRLRTC